jgi:hypothetical protein
VAGGPVRKGQFRAAIPTPEVGEELPEGRPTDAQDLLPDASLHLVDRLTGGGRSEEIVLQVGKKFGEALEGYRVVWEYVRRPLWMGEMVSGIFILASTRPF